MNFFKPTWVDAVIIAVVIAVTVIWQNVDGNTSSTGSSDSSTAVATEQANSSTSSSQGSASSGASSVSQQSNTPPEECTFRDHYDRVRGSLVEVLIPVSSGGFYAGSGFHLGNGVYVTALHVVDAIDSSVFSGTVSDDVIIGSWRTQQFYKAEVVAFGNYNFTDRGQVGSDIAVLKSEPIPDSISYRFPNELDISSDTQYRAFGFPAGAIPDNPQPGSEYAGDKPTTGKNSISKIISDAEEYIQLGTDVDFGMSGGPLVDQCGTALGIISGGQKDSPFDWVISMREYERIQ